MSSHTDETARIIHSPSMSKGQSLAVIMAALATLLVAILDTNIVTTAAVPIARALEPTAVTASIPWLMATYAVAGTVVQPIYGKLADGVGVRSVFLMAVGIFIVGSVLCGLATSMPELIVFRGLQGLGGGGLMSVTMVVIGHMRAESSDGRSNQANSGNAMAAVLVGLGLVCGPVVGGLLVHSLGWRWVFFVNIPLGVAAFVIMACALKLPKPTTRTHIDPVSAIALGLAAASLVIVCQLGGRTLPWASWQVIGISALCVASVVVFAWRQLAARQPFFPPRLLKEPTLRIVTFLQLASGCGMAAGIVYITLELQLVRGFDPIATGIRLIPMAIGLGIGAFIGTRIVAAGRPLRSSITLGTAGSAAALFGLALCTAATPMLVIYALLIAFGIGIGLGLGNEMLLVFSAVDRHDLGVATTGIRFVETLGTSVGATVFATLFSALVPSHASAAQITGIIDIVFAIGAVLMVAATLVALRLPSTARG